MKDVPAVKSNFKKLIDVHSPDFGKKAVETIRDTLIEIVRESIKKKKDFEKRKKEIEKQLELADDAASDASTKVADDKEDKGGEGEEEQPDEEETKMIDTTDNPELGDKKVSSVLPGS